MKICHFIASKGLGRGDAFVDLANAQSAKVEVCILAPKGALFASSLNDNIRLVEYLSSNTRINPRLYFELHGLLRRVNPDIVHTHFAKASEIFHALNKILHLPHVATKHNPRKGKIFNRLRNVIAVSQGVADSVQHDNVEVVYNGINPVAHKPVEKNDVFTICVVGRLDKIKGFDRLIAEVAKLDEDFLLNIVGDGEEKKNLEKQINHLGLQEKVKLLGFRSDVPDLLASADLQLMSSLSEGFSLAMVEAVFYSKVFVSTRVAGCLEILPEGLFVEDGLFAAKIRDVMQNYQKYVGLFSEVQRNYRKRLDIKEVSEQYLDYYNRVLNEKSVI